MNCALYKIINTWIISLLVVLLCPCQAKADTKIKCDSIVVTFMDGLWPDKDAQDTDSNEMGYFKCDLYLSGSNNSNDTVRFTTSMHAFMRPMNVTIENQHCRMNQKLITPSSQMFVQNWAIGPIGDGRFKAHLKYGVEAVACYFYPSFQDSNYPNVFTLDSNFGSWIPSYKEVDYSLCKITVACDDTVKYSIFHSWKYIDQEQPRFCITVVNRDYYQMRRFCHKGLDFHIYHALNRDDVSLETLYKLSNAGVQFRNNHPINIILVDWHGDLNNKEYSMGFAYNNYLVCDFSFMDDSSIIHELLHILLPIITDDGKGHYFTSESVIEWLANYLIYGEFRNVDYGTLAKAQGISLYELTSNNKEGWVQIYSDGPKYIQELANKVGSDKLFHLITIYYRDQKVIIYTDFIKYLQANLGREVEIMDSKVRNK